MSGHRFTLRTALLLLGPLLAGLAAGCGGSGTTTSSTLPAPSFAKTVNLQRVSGTVRIELPGAGSFLALSRARQVPVGTVVDVRGGVVRLTAAESSQTPTSVGDFNAGVFRISQGAANKGVVDLRIENTSSTAKTCAGAGGAKASQKLSTRQLGLLLADAHGTFRTDGEFSAATIRGTRGGVRNRCDGTLTVVRRGTVIVSDFRRHKNIVLHKGQTYLAKAS